MHFINVKILISTFLLLLMNIAQGADRDVEDDIHPYIQAKANTRNQELWEPLATENTDLLYNKSCKMEKIIQIYYQGNTLKGAVYGPKRPHGSIPIPYIACISKHVKTGKVAPKGVIIKVYGGGIALSIQKDSTFCEEKLWAQEDYIVYCLNIRGTPGFGDRFLNEPSKTEAVQDMVRDISYFTHILKNGKRDIRGQERPMGRELVTKDMPFFLMGASFGGYLTLSHATNSENEYYIKHLGVSISHRTLFTGYIPIFPVVDIWKDMKSGTSVGSRRLDNFLKNNKPTWVINAYQNKNVVDNAWDNRAVSPLSRMHLLLRPTLFILGTKDNNVSPKQTIDCINESIFHGTHKHIFLYVDGNLGHCFPSGHVQIKAYYEMIFRFMDGAALSAQMGIPLYSKDSLEKINDISYLRSRALNPGIHRPKYQFFYQAIKLFHYAQEQGLAPDHDWQRLINVQCDFFLKALIWMKEKEKVYVNWFNHRVYLDQKNTLKKAYSRELNRLNIRDLACGEQSALTLSTYYKKRIYTSRPPKYTTYYSRLMRYLGDGNYQKGRQKLHAYEEKLKSNLYYILRNYPMDLIVKSPTVATRLGT